MKLPSLSRRPFLLPFLPAALPWLAAAASVGAQVTGTLDATFAPIGAFGTVPHDSPLTKYILVESVALQADGKILAGGQFDTFDGVARSGILRFDADGTLDTGFDPGTGVSSGNPDLFANVNSLIVQPDGKVLVGGYFDHFNDVLTYSLARLNADGSLDTTFAVNGAVAYGATATLQADGKILVVTASQQYSSADELIRLNADGTTDTAFSGIPGGEYSVGVVAVQPDGKILVSGVFGSFYGRRHRSLARLNADGSLDTSFEIKGTPLAISAIAVQTDGKILISGTFARVDRVARAGLARLNADGSLDTSFDPGAGVAGGPFPSAGSIVVQADGKIVIAGGFKREDGVKRGRIARLNADGSLDKSFTSRQGANNSVYSMALQADGKIVIGGFFTAYDGVARPEIARLQ